VRVPSATVPAAMRSAALLLGLVLLTAAPPLDAPAAVRPDDAVLRDRVTSYWEARSKSNLVAAYAFYEPAFRTEFPLELFLSNFQRLLRFRPEFLGIDGVLVDADGRTARVGVRLRIKPSELNGEPLDAPSEDIWLLIDGVWYRQREPMIPSI